MTDPITSALIAGVVALIVAGFSNFGAESYRRHRDASALAAALAGELGAYLDNSPPSLIESLLELRKRAADGARLVSPKLSVGGFPVFDANVEKFGLLGPKVAEDLVYVFSNMRSYRAFLSQVSLPDATPAEQVMTLDTAIEAHGRLHVRAPALLAALHRVARREYLE